MPEIIACPRCGKKLTVPEQHLGRSARCSGCNHVFTAAGAPAESFNFAALSSSEGPDPQLEERQAAADTWHGVRLGISLVLGAAMVLVLTLALVVAVMVLFAEIVPEHMSPRQMAEARLQDLGLAAVLLQIGLAGTVLGLALWLAGLIVCVVTPGPAGGRALALTSLGLGLGALAALFAPLGFFLLSGKDLFGPAVTNLLDRGGPYLAYASIITFLLFLRSVAQGVRDKKLVRSAGSLLWLFAVLVALDLGMEVMGAAASRSRSGPLAMLGCLGVFLGFTFFLWYILTLFQFRERLAYRAKRR
jgi:MFS family permease